MLDVLRRVIQEVSATRDLDTALDIIVDRVQSTMGTEVCSVYLLDDENKQYVFMATRGLNREMAGHVTLERDEGLVGLVGERAEPVNLNNASEHPRYHYVGELGEDDYQSFLGVPIIHHRKLLGVLVVQQASRRRYDESEEAFLITLSAQLAGVIEHARATGAFSISGSVKDLPASRFPGKPGAPGVAIGTSIVIYPEADLHKVPERTTTRKKTEIRLFLAAVEELKKEIREMGNKLSDHLRPAELALFDAYLNMLDENAISGEVVELINEGVWSQTALRRVIETHISHFEAMDDAYLRERGMDVLDLGQRVLAKLQSKEDKKRSYPKGTVLIADELTASMLAEVPRGKLAGLVSVKGSGTSHVAILAKAMGVPTVMGVEDLPMNLLEGKPVIVDGFEGVVITYPNKDQLTLYRRIVKEEAAFEDDLESLKEEKSETKDGHRIGLWVNTGLMTDVARSLDRGAEGVGLYRTEMHFMTNDRFPTDE